MNWQALLDSRSDSEFFIRITTGLMSYEVKGFKSGGELTISQLAPAPFFEFTYFMVIGQAEGSFLVWKRQPVWVFTLSADGTLSWDALRFSDPVDFDKYRTVTKAQFVGLEAIKAELRKLEHPSPVVALLNSA